MTDFKAGDKVRIKDEVLTNEEGDSMWQSWRGTEREVIKACGSRDFWVKEVDGGSLSFNALLDKKHLELIETFKAGDWVYIEDETLTCCGGIDLVDPDLRGTWQRIDQVREKSEEVLLLGGEHLAIKHITHNPFSVGDRVTVADDNSIEEDGGAPNNSATTEAMRVNPVISGLPDEDGVVMVDGFYVHKRFVKPEPEMTIWYFKDEVEITVDEIIAIEDRLAGVTPEAVDHPEHYNRGAFETIDVIEDWGLNFNVGNAVKYISRYAHKGKPKEDLRKAIWYLEREIESLN